MSESTPPIGHNKPPIEELMAELSDRLKRQYPDLASEWAELEIASFSLPAPEDIDSDEKATVVYNYIQNLKAFNKKISNLHKTEKAEFLNLGRAVDNFFNEGYKTPCEARVVETEKILKPFLLAKEEAAAARARAMEEERKRLEAERQRLANEEAERQRIKQAEAEEQARKIREAEDEVSRKKAEDEMRIKQAERAREEEEEAKKQADLLAEEKRIEAENKMANKTALKGAKIVVSYTVEDVDWPELRSTLGALSPYLIDSVIMGALERAARDGNVDSPPPVIRGVFWKRNEETKVTARRGKADE